ncbi:MAG: Ig-like domain repeat protein [Anaerolineales bacterium]|nr:Ig-like domain repeat protein [Anaerolineales bacterium]
MEVAENIGPFGVRAADGPTGQIELSDPTGAISVTGELVNGGVQLESSSLDAGSYSVTAAYSGDTYHEPSVSNLVVQIVNRYATVTSLKLAPNPVLLGDQVYFTATVAWDFGFDVAGLAPQGDPILGPTGTVDVLANGVPVANAQLSNGVARIHSAVPMTGAVSITAHYRGDRASAPSVSKEVTLRIKHRTSTVILTTAPNPSQPGATVVLTATVQATPVELTYQPGIDSQADLGPTGEVIFAAQGVELGRSAIVNGMANLDYAQLPEGSHTLTARYPGDDTFIGSTSAPYVQVVQPLPTAVNDAAGVVQGQVRKVEVLANDRDPAGGGLTVTSVTQPAHGTAIIGAAGQFVYFRAATNASGLENFTYTATDANGSTSTALVSMLVASQGGGQGVPYVAAVDPALGANLAFTASGTVVDLEVSPGFYTGTLPPGDTFFMAFTPYITATGNTTTPPAGFKFGNLQFDLTSYATGTPLHGVTFAIPLTLTIDYDPAMVDNLDPATLGLFHWDGSEWSTDGITIVEHNVTEHKVTIAVSHLSEFALFAAPAGPVVTDHIYLPNLQDDDIPPIGPESGLVKPAPTKTPVAPLLFEIVEQVFLPAMEK